MDIRTSMVPVGAENAIVFDDWKEACYEARVPLDNRYMRAVRASGEIRFLNVDTPDGNSHRVYREE